METSDKTTNNSKLILGLGAAVLIIVAIALVVMSSGGEDSNATDTTAVPNNPSVPSVPNDHGHEH